jgi:hypothetical protein
MKGKGRCFQRFEKETERRGETGKRRESTGGKNVRKRRENWEIKKNPERECEVGGM